MQKLNRHERRKLAAWSRKYAAVKPDNFEKRPSATGWWYRARRDRDVS